MPTGVFAASEDFGSDTDGALDKRISRAASELAALVSGSSAVAAGAPDTTDTGRRTSAEKSFANPTPFEELLRSASEGPPQY